MYNYKLVIQYDGSRYRGWQRLGNTGNTIQGKLENVLSEMTGEPIEVTGCSRTDAGVHALAQVANFKTGKRYEESHIKEYLNRYLPKDISILDVESVPERFHARYNAKYKTYLYKIWNREYSNPFMRKYSMHVENKLDVDKMKEASQYFIGEHDFTAFSNAKSKKKSMVRMIYSVTVDQEDGFVLIRMVGNGFLYNMARKIAGTLIEVGLGKLDAGTIPDIINSRDRSRVSFIADACGLYLEKIAY